MRVSERSRELRFGQLQQLAEIGIRDPTRAQVHAGDPAGCVPDDRAARIFDPLRIPAGFPLPAGRVPGSSEQNSYSSNARSCLILLAPSIRQRRIAVENNLARRQSGSSVPAALFPSPACGTGSATSGWPSISGLRAVVRDAGGIQAEFAQFGQGSRDSRPLSSTAV